MLVNILTKSGSNTWHGSTSLLLYERLAAVEERIPAAGAQLPAPGFRPQGILVGPRRADSQGPDVLLHVRRRAAFRSRDQPRRANRDAAVHRLHEAEPAEQRLDVRDEHVPGVVHRRAELPDRRPAARLVVLGWRRHRLAGRRNPVQSAGDRRGHVQHDVAAQGPAVDRRASTITSTTARIGSTARSTARRSTRCCSAPRMSIRTSTRSRRPTACTSTRTGRGSSRRTW